MVIGSGRWNMVGGFFGDDRGIVGEFQGKGLFRFCLFSSSSEFSGGGDLGYLFLQRRASVEEVGPPLDDLMEGSVRISTC